MDQMFQIIKFVKKKKYLYTPKNNRFKNKKITILSHTHTYIHYILFSHFQTHTCIYIYTHQSTYQPTHPPTQTQNTTKFGMNFFSSNPNNPKSNTSPNA